MPEYEVKVTDAIILAHYYRVMAETAEAAEEYVEAEMDGDNLQAFSRSETTERYIEWMIEIGGTDDAGEVDVAHTDRLRQYDTPGR